MKVTTKPNRAGDGFSIRVDGKAVAWVAASGRAKVGRKYRAELGKKPVPDEVRAAIQKARAKVRRAQEAAK